MTSSSNLQYKVRALHCDHQADDETVYQVLRRATLPLSRAWDKLKAAQRIAIKFNQDFRSERVPYFEGMREQLVSDKVACARRRMPSLSTWISRPSPGRTIRTRRRRRRWRR